MEPHHLVMIHQRWYLLAFDRDRDDWRTFRVDRMGESWATGMRFEEREVPGGDAEESVRARLGEGEYCYQARVLCHAGPEELPGWVGQGGGAVESVDGGILLHLRDDSLDWLAWRLLWLGVEFGVLEPVELVEVAAAMGERLRRASGS